MNQTSFRGQQFTRGAIGRAMEWFDLHLRGSFRRWRTYAVKHNGRDHPPRELLRMIVGDMGNLSGGEPTKQRVRTLGSGG